MGGNLSIKKELIHHETEKAILLEIPIRYQNHRWGMWAPKFFTEINEDEHTVELNLPDDFIYEIISIGVSDFDNLTGEELSADDFVVSKEEFENYFDRIYMNTLILKNKVGKQIDKEIRELMWNYDLVLKNIEKLENITTEKSPENPLFDLTLHEEQTETVEKMKDIIYDLIKRKESLFMILRLPGEKVSTSSIYRKKE